MISARLKLARDAVVADPGLQGRAFGEALADAVDGAVAEAFGALDSAKNMVVVARGAGGRRERSPGGAKHNVVIDKN
jgi:hypothetical protein